MRDVGVRMLIIDEIHAVLPAHSASSGYSSMSSGSWPMPGPPTVRDGRASKSSLLDIVAKPICQDGARNQVNEMIRPWRE